MVLISMMIVTTKRVGDIPTPTFPFLLGRGTASAKSMFYMYLIVEIFLWCSNLMIDDTEGRVVDYVTRIDMQGIKSCPWLALSSLIHESWLLSQKSINTNTKVCNYGGEGPCLICIEKIQPEVFGNTSFYLFCIGLCWKSNFKTNSWLSRNLK